MIDYPVVSKERVEEVRSGKGETTKPSDDKAKFVIAAYHPGDVIRCIIKRIARTDMTELGLDDKGLMLTSTETDLLLAYRENAFNPKQIADADFGDWCRYVMASELLARCLKVEEK